MQPCVLTPRLAKSITGNPIGANDNDGERSLAHCHGLGPHLSSGSLHCGNIDSVGLSATGTRLPLDFSSETQLHAAISPNAIDIRQTGSLFGEQNNANHEKLLVDYSQDYCDNRFMNGKPKALTTESRIWRRTCVIHVLRHRTM